MAYPCRPHRCRHFRARPASRRTLATLPTGPGPGRGAAVPRAARCHRARRSPHYRHVARLPARPDPRRLRVPVPPRRSTLTGCRRIVSALRIPRGAQPGPTRQAGRGASMVRTDPRSMWTTAIVQRGIRRPPASDARQSAASLRPRPGDRGVGPTRALSSAACLPAHRLTPRRSYSRFRTRWALANNR